MNESQKTSYSPTQIDPSTMLWSPDRIPDDPSLMSFGVNTVTGKEVLLPLHSRILMSGLSKSGKSWAMRPLAAAAHKRGELVILDPKGHEGQLWSSSCRVAISPDEVSQAIDYVYDDMIQRRKDMRYRCLNVWDGQQITLLVEEGRSLVSYLDNHPERSRLLNRLLSLTHLGRSSGVALWWITSNPLTGGEHPGAFREIVYGTDICFAFRCANPIQSRTILGAESQCAPHKIPSDISWAGHGYLSDYGTDLVRAWFMDDAAVRKYCS